MRSDRESQPPADRPRRQPDRVVEPERGHDQAEAVETAAPGRRSRSKLASPDAEPADEVSGMRNSLAACPRPVNRWSWQHAFSAQRLMTSHSWQHLLQESFSSDEASRGARLLQRITGQLCSDVMLTEWLYQRTCQRCVVQITLVLAHRSLDHM